MFLVGWFGWRTGCFGFCELLSLLAMVSTWQQVRIKNRLILALCQLRPVGWYRFQGVLNECGPI